MTSYFDGNLEMLVTDSLDLKNRQMILPPNLTDNIMKSPFLISDLRLYFGYEKFFRLRKGNNIQRTGFYRNECNCSSFSTSYPRSRRSGKWRAHKFNASATLQLIELNRLIQQENQWQIKFIKISLLSVLYRSRGGISWHFESRETSWCEISWCRQISSRFCPSFSYSYLCPQFLNRIKFTMTVPGTFWCFNQTCYRCTRSCLWNHHSGTCIHVFFFLKLTYYL